MKCISLKSGFLTASLLLAVGQIAQAHSLSGALGSSPRATDLYQVTCFAEDGGPVTGHLRVSVRDNAPVKRPQVSVQILKGLLATNTTDARDGNLAYSRPVTIDGGDGVYQMLVNKSGRGAETYTIEYHCISPDGVHTGTDAAQLQNQ